MNAPRFSEVSNDYAFTPLTQDYLQETIDRYALASLDMNPVHTNTDWAARAQVFGLPETVGHGMMTMSTMTSVVTRSWGVISSNGGRVRRVESKFTKPVKVGELITATGKIKSKHYHGAGRNWVLVVVEARDRAGDVVGISEIQYHLP